MKIYGHNNAKYYSTNYLHKNILKIKDDGNILVFSNEQIYYIIKLCLFSFDDIVNFNESIEFYFYFYFDSLILLSMRNPMFCTLSLSIPEDDIAKIFRKALS